MPTYDYKCRECGHKLEAFQKITDEPLHTCPACHKETLMRGPGGGIGLSFTGDGFYKTMYGSGKESNESPSSQAPGGCCPCGKSKNSCNSSKKSE